MHIKFVFDSIDGITPMMNGFPDTASILANDLQCTDIDKSYIMIDDIHIQDQDCIYIYPIELLRYEFLEVFRNLKPRVIAKLKSLNIGILVYFPTEGFESTSNSGNYWLDKLHYQFEEFGLHKNPRFLIFGSLIIQQSYNKYVLSGIDSFCIKFDNGREFVLRSNYNSLVPNFLKRLNDIKFHSVYGLNYFEYKYKQNLQSRWANEYFKKREEITIEETIAADKSKNFLSYNGNFRSGRLALVSELFRKNLCENSYVSFIGSRAIKLEDCVTEAKSMLSYDGRIFLENYVLNWKPTHIDITADQKQTDILHSEKLHYLDTYFSLVTETETDKNILFLTEKIFKPIAFYHPFIVWGSPGILKYLRSLGYQTFPELFSEEYDEIENDHLRLTMILDQVEAFVQLDKKEKDAKFASIIEKLKFNRNLFFAQNQKFNNELKEIFYDITKITEVVKSKH